MNLRQRLLDNRIVARAQAAVIALTYMFLCTFGMLTHVHPSEEARAVRLQDCRSVLRRAASSRAALRIPSRAVTVAAPTHCPFCDWQANNQALPVMPLCLVAPLTFTFVSLRETAPVAPVFLTRSSSRAPPIA